ncbi:MULTISPECIES: hypothetical protein [unclassified Nocardioides]
MAIIISVSLFGGGVAGLFQDSAASVGNAVP